MHEQSDSVPPAGAPDLGVFADVLKRLAGRKGAHYRVEGEIAQGGQGAVLRVWDADLQRSLAMKVLHEKAGTAEGRGAAFGRSLGRFLEEAQVTGQLDHPGIVPIHELGLDERGRLFFTMKLVKGRTLKEVFELVVRGEEGWTRTRALAVLLRVCEAMAYAHYKGVVHRDLKPANVMIGRFGEVYVMDWGLARVMGRADDRDLRIAPQNLTAELVSERQRAQAEPDSPLLTLDGHIVGTPAYMSPEQARGELARIGPHSDVYSVGAMLYHLIAGHFPYVKAGLRLSNYAIWYKVQEGPPEALDGRAAGVPAELLAICTKAMAREVGQRYADMGQLAEDLAAFLEHRVVSAYDTGALVELRKWIERNHSLAAAIACALLLLVAGLSASLIFKARSDENAELARTSEQHALASERVAKQRADDLLSLSALQDLDDLVEAADRLWPPHPDKRNAYSDWLRAAQALVEARPSYEAQLMQVRARARRGSGVTEAAVDAAEQALEREEWSFADSRDKWWHNQLEKLLRGLDALADPDHGLMRGRAGEHGWGIERRKAFAETLVEESISGADAERAWQPAIESIADPRACPLYHGLRIRPQLGLLPLGRDPASGLWEFAHLLSGMPARRGRDGALALCEASGIVFVLVPGGSFWMGAQLDDPRGRNFDPGAQADESPVHEVVLAPFFLSKYEMTQGQWLGFVGRNPSRDGPKASAYAGPRTLLNPVESVSLPECVLVLSRMGLVLPTEAQWEYAARAGTSSPWWTGSEPESLECAVNIADAHARAHGGSGWPGYELWLDDGATTHAPVGSYLPNAFGLHDVAGNVWEWCRDVYGAYELPVSPGDGERLPDDLRRRVYRGGGIDGVATHSRSADRTWDSSNYRLVALGLRPARPVEP